MLSSNVLEKSNVKEWELDSGTIEKGTIAEITIAEKKVNLVIKQS